MREWEHDGSGYGIGWIISIINNGFRVVHHSGGTIGVSTVLALVSEENLVVAILSNTHSQWPERILIGILRTPLSDKLKDFPGPTDQAVEKPPFTPDKDLAGLWEGYVHTCDKEIPLVLDIRRSGNIHTTLGDQSPKVL